MGREKESSHGELFSDYKIQTVLFVYLIIGYICRKINIFSNEMRSKFTDFVLFVTLPCMVFNSFNMEFSLEILGKSGLTLIVAAAIAAVSLVMAAFLFRFATPEKEKVLKVWHSCE